MLVSTAFGAVSYFALLEIRHRVVMVLIRARSPLSMDVTIWSKPGESRIGNLPQFQRKYIWGKESAQLMALPELSTLIWSARLLYVIYHVAICGLISAFAFGPLSEASLWVKKSVAHAPVLKPNPSIERTSQRPLRALWSTAHVER